MPRNDENTSVCGPIHRNYTLFGNVAKIAYIKISLSHFHNRSKADHGHGFAAVYQGATSRK